MQYRETEKFLESVKSVYDFVNSGQETVAFWQMTLTKPSFNECQNAFKIWVKNNSKAPKPADIYKIWENMKQKEKPKLVENEEFCYTCYDTGLVKYVKEIEGSKYEFLARCTCDKARNYPQIKVCINQIMDSTQIAKENKANYEKRKQEAIAKLQAIGVGKKIFGLQIPDWVKEDEFE